MYKKNILQRNILSVAKQLIRLPTVTRDRSALSRSFRFIQSFFRGTDIIIKPLRVAGITSLLICMKPRKHYRLLLLGHLDVVSGSAHIFRPRVRDGRLYGRGSADMKGAIASMLVLLRDLALQRRCDDRLALLLTTDEEVGGQHGAGAFIRNGFRSDLVFVPDGGRRITNLVNAARGIIQWDASIKTKGGTASVGSTNSIDILIKFYQKIRVWVDHPSRAHRMSFNLGKIVGGEAVNQSAQSCVMSFDFRYAYAKDGAALLRLLQQLSCASHVRITMRNYFPPSLTSPKHPSLRLYKNVAEKVLATPISFYEQKGTHDGRYFTQRGIPVIATRPNAENLHADDEWVEINSLVHLYRILDQFIPTFFEAT